MGKWHHFCWPTQSFFCCFSALPGKKKTLCNFANLIPDASTSVQQPETKIWPWLTCCLFAFLLPLQAVELLHLSLKTSLSALRSPVFACGFFPLLFTSRKESDSLLIWFDLTSSRSPSTEHNWGDPCWRVTCHPESLGGGEGKKGSRILFGLLSNGCSEMLFHPRRHFWVPVAAVPKSCFDL